MWQSIQSVEQVNQQNGAKIVVYGKAKAGKTRLCATAPRPLILSAERGLLSLQGSGLPAIEIQSIAHLETVQSWLANDPQARQHFSTICLDSLTDLMEKFMRDERAKAGKDSFAAWGKIGEKAWKICMDMRNLPNFNVYIICHQEYDKDETGCMFNMPSIPGKEAMKGLPYWFDVVAQLNSRTNAQTGQYESALRCIGDATNFAGDRSGKLAMWEPPDLGRLFAKLIT